MEASLKYPKLSRYCYAWDWLVQFRVYKPKKQKKEWVDWTELLGTDADDAVKALGFLCERKGWILLDAYYFKPTTLAFAFDRDAPNTQFLTKEQKTQFIPLPEARGSEYCPQTPAQRQQARQVKREAQQRQRQEQRQQQKRNQERRRIMAAYPLLAAELLGADYPRQHSLEPLPREQAGKTRSLQLHIIINLLLKYCNNTGSEHV